MHTVGRFSSRKVQVYQDLSLVRDRSLVASGDVRIHCPYARFVRWLFWPPSVGLLSVFSPYTVIDSTIAPQSFS